jgi:E3 ubiquitin-protein ligase RNF31
VEYLAALITKNDVDPLDIFSSDELETLLQTASIRRPSRNLPPNAPLVSYRRRLLEVSLKGTDPFSFLFFFSLFLCCCLEMHAAPADLLLIYCVRLPSLAALHSCSQHYIEYLVQLINFKKIDPLSVFEGSELIAQLRRSAIDIPERLENESDAEFYGRCAQVN